MINKIQNSIYIKANSNRIASTLTALSNKKIHHPINFKNKRSDILTFVKIVNKALIFIIIFILSHSTYYAYFTMANRMKGPSIGIERNSAKISNNITYIPEIKAFEKYKNIVERRNIFQPIRIEASSAQNKELINDFKKELRVVGIIASDDPIVVIEDLKDKKNVFLSNKGKIRDIVIENICKDRVVFKYRGSEFSMEF